MVGSVADPISSLLAAIATRTGAELATRLATNVIAGASKSLADIYRSITTSFRPHLEATFVRCTKVKTILNREEPADLLSMYVPLKLACWGKLYDQYELMDEFAFRRRAVITGRGGSGKSFFMKYLWISIFENPAGKIPIFVELRKLNDGMHVNLLGYIHRYIADTNSPVSEESFRKAINSGLFTFLLDGFDEVESERRNILAKQILDLAWNYPKCSIMVSGRDDDVFKSWQLFSVFRIQPLDETQVLDLIGRISYEESVKSKFSERVRDDLWIRHESFLSNPLLATLMLMTFAVSADIPMKMHIFYEQAFDTLFYKHDAVKELYQRKMHTDLSSDSFRRYFSLFCFLSYHENRYEFTEQVFRKYIERVEAIEAVKIDAANFLRDLSESICMLQRDGTSFVFSHRSFQEYFAAYCIDRVLSQKARPILERLAPRTYDNVIPMLFEMNRDLVETNLILPFLSWMEEKMGLLIWSDESLARYLESFGVVFTFAVRADRVVHWEKVSDVKERVLITITRLYEGGAIYQGDFHSAARIDEVAETYRTRGFPSPERDHSDITGENHMLATKARVHSSGTKLVCSVDGVVVEILRCIQQWFDEAGEISRCRDQIDQVSSLRDRIVSRQKCKNDSIDELLRD